ncbi:limonene-1,2-epoxide hydrolase family protein [Williamsia soli]|uniref:limonene-1,2-epoxide hydrolase family protein n=1 Tax=Williamsia soli TaxID=364929 RepID=UPI001A9F74F9|nr:limonene-1,2-epoxide hydrolase family protein [Williamsia soli]
MAEKSPAEISQLFLEALALDDPTTALTFVDPDIAYTNVGFAPIHGKRRVAKFFKVMENPRVGFGVQFINVTADGSVVLTERIDELSVGRFRLQFWVCGRFEVHDGLITVWRDYFDFFQFFVKAPLRGLVALALPGTQKPLPKPTVTGVASIG